MAYNKRLVALLRLVIAIQASLAQDQKCYYGNGKEAPEKPCSSADGSACCPDKWACLDNGLCYYEADNLYGRYSCTDKTWKAAGCPSNVCTYGDLNRNIGGEDIRQCKDHNNQWCCNANNQDVHCCDEWPEPRPFFDIPDGKQYALIGSSTASSAPNLASITYLAVGDGNSQTSKTDSPSSSNKPQSSDSPSSSDKPSESSASTTPAPVTSLQTSVTSGSAGPSTVIITKVQTPTSESSTNEPQTSKKSNLPVIVGCAVGIPLGLALIGILFWLLRKHRNQNKNPYSETPDPYTNGGASPDFAGGAKLSTKPEMTSYKSENNVPELAGQGVGPGRPISMIPGKAEMDSGAGFSQGAVPYGPNTVGIGGGNGHTGAHHAAQNSWGSAPPGYSPGMNQAAWAPAHRPAGSDGSVPSEMDAKGTAPTVGGAAAPPVTEGGRYIPYRPPAGHAAQTGPSGLQNVSELPELSAVRTPPA